MQRSLPNDVVKLISIISDKPVREVQTKKSTADLGSVLLIHFCHQDCFCFIPLDDTVGLGGEKQAMGNLVFDSILSLLVVNTGISIETNNWAQFYTFRLQITG
jgi:hypothetical protein